MMMQFEKGQQEDSNPSIRKFTYKDRMTETNTYMNFSLEKKISELLEKNGSDGLMDNIQEQRAIKEDELVLKAGLYIEEIAKNEEIAWETEITGAMAKEG